MSDNAIPPSDQVYLISFSKAQLAKIPDQERRFVFVGAHFLNEVQMLAKLAFFCTQNLPDTETHRSCQMAQAAMIGRLLHGKLNEGNRQLSAHGAVLHRFQPTPDISKSRERLNNYFGDAALNISTHIRTNYAFHYTPEGLDRAFQDCEPDTVFTATLARGVGNTLMTFVEELAIRGAMKDGPKQLTSENLTIKMLRTALPLTADFNDIVQHYIGEIIEKYAPGALHVSRGERVSLDGLPSLVDIGIPFLVKTPK